jgi:hypothetical protein
LAYVGASFVGALVGLRVGFFVGTFVGAADWTATSSAIITQKKHIIFIIFSIKER